MHELARLTPMGRLRMIRRLEAGTRLGDVAAALDLSTTSVRRWWRRYQQEGIAGLTDRSSRPHRSPRALPRVRCRQITRRRQWGWSSLRIARDLRLPLPTVVHVQRRLGFARRPRPAAPPSGPAGPGAGRRWRAAERKVVLAPASRLQRMRQSLDSG